MLGARRVRGYIWMQTSGGILIAVKRYSLLGLWMLASDGLSAHVLLH
jgi:hypothetical protein